MKHARTRPAALRILASAVFAFGLAKSPIAWSQGETARAEPTGAKPAKGEEPGANPSNRDRVRAVIDKHLKEVLECHYALPGDAGQKDGLVVMTWEINGKGRVEKAAADPARTTLKSEILEGCIVDHLKSWKFPEPPEGEKTTTVTFPFQFKNPKAVPPAVKKEAAKTAPTEAAPPEAAARAEVPTENPTKTPREPVVPDEMWE